MKKAENEVRFRRNLVPVTAVAVAVQASLFGLFPLTTYLGNFDFLLYVLFGVITVLDWVMLFWRTLYTGRRSYVRVQEGVITKKDGFLKQYTVIVPAAELAGISFREHVWKTAIYYHMTAYVNAKKLRFRYLTAEQKADILAAAGESGLPATPETGKETEYRESNFRRILSGALAFIAALFTYVAISAFLYGNVLMVCQGEHLCALLFAIGTTGLTVSLSFLPSKNKSLYFGGEHLRYGASSSVLPSPERVSEKEQKVAFLKDVVRFSVYRGWLCKLFGCVRVDVSTMHTEFRTYLKKKDFAEVAERLPFYEKEEDKKDDFCVRKAPMVSVFCGLKALVTWLAGWVLFSAVASGIIYRNGERFKNFLPGKVFLLKIFVLVAIGAGVIAVAAALVCLIRLIGAGMWNADCRMNVFRGYFRISSGKTILKEDYYALSSMRRLKEKKPLFAPFGTMTCLSAGFAAGRRKQEVVLGKRYLFESEAADAAALFPDFVPASCVKQAKERFYPEILFTGLLGMIPALFFSIMESWTVLFIGLILAAALVRHAKCRSFAENASCLSERRGLLSTVIVTAKKEQVCMLTLWSGFTLRAFRRQTAEISLKNTEEILVFPALNKEEGEKLRNLIKHSQNV